MNAEAIRNTAVLREQDGDYIVQSPLCPEVIGAGDTEQEAWQIFEEILEDYLADHKAGRVAKELGRPRKNKIRFHTEIDPDVKAAIAALAKQFGVSQGEAVEYLFRRFAAESNWPSKT